MPKEPSERFDQIKYQNDFIRKHYDRIELRVKKGQKELIKNAASKAGQSLNEYVSQAIRERMEKELKLN